MARSWMAMVAVLCVGAVHAAPLTEESCSVLVTGAGQDVPTLHEVPGLSVINLRPERPLAMRPESGVKVDGIVCWRSEARLAEHDDLVLAAGFPLFVKTEHEDESRNRTLALEQVGRSFRVRLVDGPKLTDAEGAEVKQLLALYEARASDRARRAEALSSSEIVALSPNAPVDQPHEIFSDELKKYEEAIAPHIAQAKQTWPDAKRRYLAGLPAGHTFFVTTRLHDPEGRWESVFVRVQSIRQGVISGRIATQLNLIQTHKFGDAYSFREDALVDWMIGRPDGSEEGNVVGKFLDTYQP